MGIPKPFTYARENRRSTKSRMQLDPHHPKGEDLEMTTNIGATIVDVIKSRGTRISEGEMSKTRILVTTAKNQATSNGIAT
jgi:hypothetical protein